MAGVWLKGGKFFFKMFFFFFYLVIKNFQKFSDFFFNTELAFAKLPPLILHNLLADRPAPRGAAGGAGGGPPCKSKKTTFKIF